MDSSAISSQAASVKTASKQTKEEQAQKGESPSSKSVSSPSKDTVQISEEAKARISEIKKDESKAIARPGIFFITGFDWFGASTIKGDYDGIRDMAKRFEGAKHFTWDQKDELMERISQMDPKAPLVLIGHSFGGDTAVEIANELNSLDQKFRKIDLIVTLDSVGFDNDLIPENVTKNLNFFQNEGFFIKDTANAARDHNKTKVMNFFSEEAHAELDDSKDIQRAIFEELQSIV